ncbi:DUF6884 domain-containing protein [Albimonas pacifica]|uniref:DUF6884 domain-containing protein n=1 Tax=Albimonas pacifica TaxID=1114924 RepID=A0A1I3D5V2_9RHOB|nr:DUF6884 domain-containing protein [Albimonas pacifica]SFH81968.1 hypothetical protein SAMN05216258_102399 [Albimonas pacifica]
MTIREGRRVDVLHLVSGGARQQPRAEAARDLYDGLWFRSARARAERAGDAWFILSARHGLLEPEARVQPYADRLDGRSAAALRAWVTLTTERMERMLPEAGRVVVLCDRDPPPELLRWLRVRYPEVETPLAGLNIAAQVLHMARDADRVMRAPPARRLARMA